MQSAYKENLRENSEAAPRRGGEEAQTREFVDGGILEQAKLRTCNAFTRYVLRVHLNMLSGMSHLLMGDAFSFFRLFDRKRPHFTHDTEQALQTAGIAALQQMVPKLYVPSVGFRQRHHG